MADVFDMPPLSAGFDARGAWLVRQLMQDAGLTPEQAAGIVGNFGGESGLEAIQERAPVSGRGGFGWAQWTADRRTNFEKWCAEHRMRETDDAANYGFLLDELRGPYAHALAQVKKTSSLKAAVYTFEYFFERPANMQSGLADRVSFGKRALAAFNAAGLEIPPRPSPLAPPVIPPQRFVPPPIQETAHPPPAVTTVPAMSQVGAFAVGAGGASIPAKAFVATLVWLLEPWRAVPDELQLLWLGTVVIIGGLVAHSVIVSALRDRIVRDLQA